MKKDSYLFGVLYVFVGGVFWGFSGACGQYLFTYKGVEPLWLTTVRLLVAGFVLLAFEVLLKKRKIFHLFSDKNSIFTLLIFSVFGLVLCQYTYYLAIFYSNVAIATVLQYLAPAIIIFLIMLKSRKLPKFIEFLALILATSGVFILSTHGKFSLALPLNVLIIGILSACCVVIYSTAPIRLNKKYGVITTLGFGMLIGGIILSFFTKNLFVFQGDIESVLALFGVVFFGTICAFGFYMLGLNIVGPARATLIASVEPVSSAFFAHFWLGSRFVTLDYVGFVLILSCTFVLAKK